MPADTPLGVPGLGDADVVGRGGYGTVYSAEEPEFGRRVAVKVLHDRLDGDDVRRAFVRECQAMGSLSGHPHIVTVHRGGTTERGEPYIVMDLMTAGSLADRLRRDGPLPWAEVVEIGVIVAGALETAHRAGILHLDLKPANLLVSRYGEPKLGDFGISRMPGVTSSTGEQVRASAAYAAPERLLEGTATVASDLYGLGATLFALLTGRPAFVTDSGDDLLAVVARVARDPVPDLRARGVPDPVARAVERLMAKSPADRYPSAADAASALQDAQRATGQAVTKAVVEGALPVREGTVTWPVHRSEPAAAPAPTAPTPVPAPMATPVSSPAPPPPRTPPPAPVPLRTGPPPPQQAPSWPPPYAPAPTLVGATAAPPTPTADRRPLVITAVVLAVVVALGAVGIAAYLNWPVATDPGGPGVRAAAGATTTPAASTTTAAPPTSAPTSTPTAAPPPPPPTDGLVTIASDVTHPAAADARTALDVLYTGINESRYADAFAVFSPDSDSAKGGLELWQDGLRTTTIDDPTIVAVRDGDPGEIEGDVIFTSYQAPQDSPDGQQSCTRWELSYEMVDGPGWLVRKARPINPPLGC